MSEPLLIIIEGFVNDNPNYGAPACFIVSPIFKSYELESLNIDGVLADFLLSLAYGEKIDSEEKAFIITEAIKANFNQAKTAYIAELEYEELYNHYFKVTAQYTPIDEEDNDDELYGIIHYEGVKFLRPHEDMWLEYYDD